MEEEAVKSHFPSIAVKLSRLLKALSLPVQASLKEPLTGGCWTSLSLRKHQPVKRSFLGSYSSPSDSGNSKLTLYRSWFNHKSEMYQNCAVIQIQKGGTGISSYPDMLKANIGNDCRTGNGDVVFLDPGNDTSYGDWNSTFEYPEGSDCGPQKLVTMEPVQASSAKTITVRSATASSTSSTAASTDLTNLSALLTFFAPRLPGTVKSCNNYYRALLGRY